MEKNEKTDDPVILHSRQMGKGKKPNNRIVLLRWMPNLFFHHRDNIDFQLQYGGTFV